MKLSYEDLKRLYRSSCTESAREKGACPSIDFLMSSFLPETSEEDKLRVADHVTGCDSCRAKFELAREILGEASRLARESAGVELTEAEAAALRQRAASRLKEMERRPRAGSRKEFSERWRAFFFRYRYASVAAGAVMIAAAIFLVLRAPQIKDTGAMRGEAGAALVLIAPRGVQKALPLHFEWQPYPGARAYEVKVLDGKLNVVWTSGRIRTTSLNLPSGPAEGLNKGDLYYWKVSAFSDDETIQESNLQSFQLPE